MCSTGGNFGNGVESASWNRFSFWFKLQRSLRRRVKRDETRTPHERSELRYHTLQAVQILVAAQAVGIQSLAVVVGDTACSQMGHDWVNPSSFRVGCQL